MYIGAAGVADAVIDVPGAIPLGVGVVAVAFAVVVAVAVVDVVVREGARVFPAGQGVNVISQCHEAAAEIRGDQTVMGWTGDDATPFIIVREEGRTRGVWMDEGHRYIGGQMGGLLTIGCHPTRFSV